MSLELTHTYDLYINDTHAGRVKPKGTFSLTLQKESSRYRFMLQGKMTFTGSDFNLIYYTIKPSYPNAVVDRCAEFVLRCSFKGYVWRGYFTETDCEIHTSKGYIEVEPHTDDGYRNFLPYLDTDFNIMPEYRGVKNDASVSGIFPFLTERITEEISTRYSGPGSDHWAGYSVNDWINGLYHSGYTYVGGKHNSLIHYLADDKRFGAMVDHFNQLLWLDHEGYVRKIGDGDEPDFQKAVHPSRRYFHYPDLFTLTEVINHYDDNHEWQRCELVYEREVWPHNRFPPAGIMDGLSLVHWGLERQGLSQEDIAKELKKLPLDVKNHLTGWMWYPDERIWRRRPYAMGEIYLGGLNAARSAAFGDGTWFSDLSDFIPTPRGFIKKQVLNHNPNYANYADFNRHITVDGVLHRIPAIINKFIKFVVEQGGEEVILESQYLSANTTPLPYLTLNGQQIENEWPRVLIMQNSDIRQVEGTEKATTQEFSFSRFLDMICDMSNAGWAIVTEGDFGNETHRLLIEHKLFFENGLSYDTPTDFINPQDIYNFAKNKNFLRFSNQYRFNRPEMQKNEVFRTLGGDEPTHDNSWITYDSKCANNLPGQNKREVNIESATTDYYYVMGEQINEGITFVKAALTGIGAMWQFELPLEADMFGRYRINANFHLQHILMQFHTYGRSFKDGFINSYPGEFLTRPYVLQNIFFRYREQLNPYQRVLTELGVGVIMDGSLNTMTGILDLTLGYHEGVLTDYNMPEFNWPAKWEGGYTNLYFHKHVQTEPSDRWHIFHNFGTDAIMRPIVFQDEEEEDIDIDIDADVDQVKNEIGYQGLIRMSLNTLVMEFSTPITGEAYFLSFGFFDPYAHVQAEPSDTWEMPHGFDTIDVSHSIIWGADDREIRHADIVIVDDNNMEYLFTESVSGNMYLAVTPLVTTIDDIDASEVEVSRPYQHPLKPLILRLPSEINYDTNKMEETLIRLGFTHEVIATIIVKHYD